MSDKRNVGAKAAPPPDTEADKQINKLISCNRGDCDFHKTAASILLYLLQKEKAREKA